MGKKKLKKFEELNTLPNVYQNFTDWPKERLVNCKGETVDMKGKWRAHFGNEQPIVLELACGRGEYSIGMARLTKEKNFIGIDIKGNRIWGGATLAIDEKLNHVAFIRSRIESLENIFAPGEVSEIWITFPDPFLPERRLRKRLTYTRFLHLYQNILVPNGNIHLKTDSRPLYEFTLEMLELNQASILSNNEDIYHKGYEEPLLDIKTKYEKMHLKDGRLITYLKFQLPHPISYNKENKEEIKD